jgi:hypothetical protein
VVDVSETAFVSIANSADADYFSFEVAAPTALNVMLTPRGGVFNQAPQGSTQTEFNANARSDLTLALFDTNGTTLLGIANQTPEGEPESLTGIQLLTAGIYYARVIGSTSIVQMYQLDLTAVAPATLLPGDFNRNGEVDAADYSLWRISQDESGPDLPADANHDLIVDLADYQIWRANFGTTSGSTTAFDTGAVPEPAGGVLALLAGLMLLGSRKLAGALRRTGIRPA